MTRSTTLLGFCLLAGIALAAAGCGPSYDSPESAREEVQRQNELQKTQAAEEAVLNAELMRGERRK